MELRNKTWWQSQRNRSQIWCYLHCPRRYLACGTASGYWSALNLSCFDPDDAQNIPEKVETNSKKTSFTYATTKIGAIGKICHNCSKYTHSLEKREIHCHALFFVKAIYSKKFKNVDFTEFWTKMCTGIIFNYHSSLQTNEKFSLSGKKFRQIN